LPEDLLSVRVLFAPIAFIVALTSPLYAQQAPPPMDLSPIGQPAPDKRLAPADVTFGHYHFSMFGIENEIALAGSRFRDESERAELEGGAFYYVVDAIRDWERRYPNDPGIAHDLYEVHRVYRRLHNAIALQDADRALAWLVHDYPSSKYAAMARAEAQTQASH
jgi:hypothetical protein